MTVDDGSVSRIESGAELAVVPGEVYTPPRDLRPEVVSKDSLERHAITVGGKAIAFTAVTADSEALPEGVDIGYVSAEVEGEEPTLVVRKRPRTDIGNGIGYMGDGQRQVIDSEPGRVREFLLGGAQEEPQEEQFKQAA
jgi:hypothetical protein